MVARERCTRGALSETVAPPVHPPLLPLALVVFAAFAVEASLGFGSALLTVTLGSILCPIGALLPAFVPLNLMLSLYIATRYRRDVDRALLLRRVVPAMLAGLPIGLVGFRFAGRGLSRALAAFVLALAAIELLRLARGAASGARPLGRARSALLLVLAGAAHGAFATGGPLAVYVVGRDLGGHKARFRATMSTLWLSLNTVMLASYLWMGKVDGASARTTLALVAPLVLGLLAGEAAHARVPAKAFRALVFVVLGAGGAALLARG